MDARRVWTYCLKFKIQQKEKEFIEFLSLLIDEKVKTVLEIGCNTGGTARGFLEIGCNVTCIDIVKFPEIKMLEKGFKDRFKHIKGDSRSLSIQKQVAKDYDLVWIDGEHTEATCRSDYEMYGIMGRIVAFHDIVESEHHTQNDCFVSKVWGNIKETKKWKEIVHGDRKWGGIGVCWNN